MTVDSVSAMVVALKACYESDIFLTTYLGNILNHVYWFQIGTNENTEVKLLKNGMEVFTVFTVFIVLFNIHNCFPSNPS